MTSGEVTTSFFFIESFSAKKTKLSQANQTFLFISEHHMHPTMQCAQTNLAFPV